MQRIRPVFARALVLGAIVPLALAASAPGAAAQGLGGSGAPHMVRIGAAGGVIVPTSDTRNALKQGIQGQAFVLLNVLQSFPLRFNLGYQKLNLKSVIASSTQQAVTGGDTKIFSGTAGTQIELLHGPLRPYITAGLGGFSVKSTLEGSSVPDSPSQFKFGIDGGAGIALQLGRLSAFVEGKVQNIYTDAGAINAKNIQAVPVSFGILF